MRRTTAAYESESYEIGWDSDYHSLPNYMPAAELLCNS